MSAFYVTAGGGGGGGGGEAVVCVVRSTIQSFPPKVQAALRGIIHQLGTTSASFSSQTALSDSSTPLICMKNEKDLQRTIQQALAMFITPWTTLADILDPDNPPGPQVMRFVRSSRPVERIALATSPDAIQLAVLPEILDELNLTAELEGASTWWTSHESVLALRRIHNADKEVKRLDQVWEAQLMQVRTQLSSARERSGTSLDHDTTSLLSTLLATHTQRRQAAIELAQALDVPSELEDLYEQEMSGVRVELGDRLSSTAAAAGELSLQSELVQDVDPAGTQIGHETIEHVQEDYSERAASVRMSAIPVVSIADPSAPSLPRRRSARIASALSTSSSPATPFAPTELARPSSSTRQRWANTLAPSPVNTVPTPNQTPSPTPTPHSRSETRLSVSHMPIGLGFTAQTPPSRPQSGSNPRSRSGASSQSRKLGPTRPDTALVMHRQDDRATLIYLFLEFKFATYAAREHTSDKEQLHIFKRKEGFWQTVWYLWMITLSPSNSRLHVVATIVNDRLVRVSLDPDRSRLYVEHTLDDDQIATPIECRELDVLDSFWSTEHFGTSIGTEDGFHRMIALQVDAIKRAYKDMLAELGDASGAESEVQPQPAPSFLSLEATDRIVAAMAWHKDECKKSYENAKSRIKARGSGGPPGGGAGAHRDNGRGDRDDAGGSGQDGEGHAPVGHTAVDTKGENTPHPGAAGVNTSPPQEDTFALSGETCTGAFRSRVGEDTSNRHRPSLFASSSSLASISGQESSSFRSSPSGDPLAWTRCRSFFTGPDAPPLAVLLVSTANMDRVISGHASLRDIWESADLPVATRAAAPSPISPASSFSSSLSSATSQRTGTSPASDSPASSPTSAFYSPKSHEIQRPRSGWRPGKAAHVHDPSALDLPNSPGA